MKDLIEVRFTVATKELNGKVLKSLKPFAKILEPYAERVLEVITNHLEVLSKNELGLDQEKDDKNE
jgi:hypothetical protein